MSENDHSGLFSEYTAVRKTAAGYRKVVIIEGSGIVLAQVFAPDGRRCGRELFLALLPSPWIIERAAKRAHKWADGLIAVCERQEVTLHKEHGRQEPTA